MRHMNNTRKVHQLFGEDGLSRRSSDAGRPKLPARRSLGKVGLACPATVGKQRRNELNEVHAA